jgi:hypothetical protein
MRRSSAALVFSLVSQILFLTGTPAWAWGRVGHRVIARMAEPHISPAARDAIAELLERGESLADRHIGPAIE